MKWINRISRVKTNVLAFATSRFHSSGDMQGLLSALKRIKEDAEAEMGSPASASFYTTVKSFFDF